MEAKMPFLTPLEMIVLMVNFEWSGEIVKGPQNYF